MKRNTAEAGKRTKEDHPSLEKLEKRAEKKHEEEVKSLLKQTRKTSDNVHSHENIVFHKSR